MKLQNERQNILDSFGNTKRGSQSISDVINHRPEKESKNHMRNKNPKIHHKTYHEKDKKKQNLSSSSETNKLSENDKNNVANNQKHEKNHNDNHHLDNAKNKDQSNTNDKNAFENNDDSMNKMIKEKYNNLDFEIARKIRDDFVVIHFEKLSNIAHRHILRPQLVHFASNNISLSMEKELHQRIEKRLFKVISFT